MSDLTPVREAHRFDEQKLADYLADHLDANLQDLKIQQFEGGQSNPTFLISNGSKQFVMRKQPPGKLLKSAHQVDREYRVMDALYRSDVPVPRMHLLCLDPSIIGTKFYVMDYVEGRVIADPSLPGFSQKEREAFYKDFIRVLAALHRVDYREIGLSDFGHEGNYYERQISRWSKQYRASETERIAEMDFLIDWLPANIPDTRQTSLVHGDFRCGNCIIAPDEPRISAVLDWELSTTGHPLADLGYAALMYYGGNPDSSGASPAKTPGVPTESEFVKLYLEASGRQDIPNWDFYIIYNLFRIAAICEGVYKRGLDGNASSDLWKPMHPACISFAKSARQLVKG